MIGFSHSSIVGVMVFFTSFFGGSSFIDLSIAPNLNDEELPHGLVETFFFLFTRFREYEYVNTRKWERKSQPILVHRG